MLRDPFFKALRDHSRSLVLWVVGVAFYVALLMSIYPSIKTGASDLQGYIDSLPDAVKTAFLGSAADFSSPVGYVNVELLSWLAPIVFIAFAVSVAGRSLAGEEENGTLGLVLTSGLSRPRFVLQKYSAMVVVVAALGAGFWLSVVIATRVAGTPIGAGDLATAFLRLTLLGLAVGSITYAVGGATGRRQAGIAAGAGVGLLMYLVNTLAAMNETIRPFRYLSLFHYSGGAAPIGQALGAGDLAALVGTPLALLAATLVLFARRDLRA